MSIIGLEYETHRVVIVQGAGYRMDLWHVFKSGDQYWAWGGRGAALGDLALIGCVTQGEPTGFYRAEYEGDSELSGWHLCLTLREAEDALLLRHIDGEWPADAPKSSLPDFA